VGASANFIASTTTATGLAVIQDGRFTLSRSGTPMFITRLGSDGSLIEFWKDGSTVGSIGTASSKLTLTDTRLVDNDKLSFGNSDDLQIYHDGSNSWVNDTGAGDLILQGTQLRLRAGNNENHIYCTQDGSVQVYNNGSVKLATTSTGVKVTGGNSDSLVIENTDSGSGNAPDLVLYRNSSSPADNDSLGVIQFRGKHSAGGTHNYVQIQAKADDVTDTTEDAHLGFFIANAGSNSEEFRMKGNGDFHADGDVIAYSTTISDERLKENIQPIDDALAKVKQLKGCTFTYTADGKESAGLIAQDVEKVLPSAVSEKELPLKQDDGIAYKTLQYDQTIGLLVEAIKELSAKVEELENR